MRKRRRWVLLVLLALFAISISVGIWLVLLVDRAMVGPPHRIKAYTHILETLPTPPGWQSQTDHIWLSSGAAFAYRDYKVAESYAQVLEFFETELPQPGWSLLKREQHNQMTSLLFYSEEHYCLGIAINERITDETEKVYVYIELREDPSENRCEF
jgi:hypothetical protein